MSTFLPLEVMGRSSDTPLRVGENVNKLSEIWDYDNVIYKIYNHCLNHI